MPGPGPSWRISSLAQGNGLLASAARFWQRSYASDYLGFIMLLIAYLLVQFFADPFHRMFSLDNISLQYPHAEAERVPVWLLFVYVGAVPLGILVAWAAVTQPGVHKAHVSMLGLFISLILSSFITDIIKNAVGRPRPDLIDRCKPQPGTPEHTLVTYTICTQPDHHTLHDGWRSFPSGHSSFAFAGLGYLFLFLAGQLHVFRPRSDLARFLITLAPLLGAALIAISRCEDYRHDVYDVTIGSALGMTVAWCTYRRYYPSLRSLKCDTPYPLPSETLEVKAYKRGDEESRMNDFEVGDDSEEESERRPLASSRP